MGRVESEVELLGCTGIEDRLQDNVARVMTDMRVAGIKVWMLTGDKLETAENIGRSCGLIAIGSQVHRLKDTAQISQRLEEISAITLLARQHQKK